MLVWLASDSLTVSSPGLFSVTSTSPEFESWLLLLLARLPFPAGKCSISLILPLAPIFSQDFQTVHVFNWCLRFWLAVLLKMVCQGSDNLSSFQILCSFQEEWQFPCIPFPSKALSIPLSKPRLLLNAFWHGQGPGRVLRWVCFNSYSIASRRKSLCFQRFLWVLFSGQLLPKCQFRFSTIPIACGRTSKKSQPAASLQHVWLSLQPYPPWQNDEKENDSKPWVSLMPLSSPKSTIHLTWPSWSRFQYPRY